MEEQEMALELTLVEALEVDAREESKEDLRVLPEGEMNKELRRYHRLKDQSDKTAQAMKDIKDEAQAFIDYRNVTPDAKGSRKLALEEGRIESINRRQTALDEEKAVDFCKARANLTSCVEEVTVWRLNEEEFERKILSGEITTEDLRDLVVIRTNTALYIKKPKG